MNQSNSFHRLLDSTYMQGVFQHYVMSKSKIHYCAIMQTHFKEFFKPESEHKSYLAVSYKVSVGETKAIVYVKGYKDGYSHTALHKLKTPPTLYLEDLDLLLWLFPSDPQLAHLTQAINAEEVKPFLPFQVRQVNVNVVNYRPEIRCTAWYQLDDQYWVFGKIYADDRYQTIYQRLNWMWNHRSNKDFLMAPLAGYNHDIKTFWQHKLEGESLINYLNPHNFQDLMHQAAQRLAFLNHCAMPCPERETNQEQLNEVCKKIKKLKRVFPDLEARLDKLETSLEQDVSQLETVPTFVVHGDFHLRQMLVHQEHLALFDFDECSRGDPIEDLAHFIADLYTYSFETSRIEALTQSFLKAYQQHHDWDIPPKRLSWHVQIQFINRAYRNYLQHKPNLVQSVEAAINLAEDAYHTFTKSKILEVA